MFSDNFYQQLRDLPDYVGSHLEITLIALGVGIGISLPLAIAVAKWPPGRWPVLTLASIVQTIPSLALLALMVPLLNRLGFWPTVVALTFYSMLPILRNTVTGIIGVDPAMTEAARGLGMTPMQVLTRVELPLAAPIIIAGVRTATVWVIGIATLSTPVGQESLGNYIFSGLHLRNWTMVLFGCVAAAVLALIFDSLIAILQSAAEKGSKTRAVLAVLALAVVLIGGLGASTFVKWAKASGVSSQNHRDTETLPTQTKTTRVIKIAAKSFAEQYILAALLQDRLEKSGFRTQVSSDLGSTVAFDGLASNKFDVYVDYTGTIWSNVMKRKETLSSARTLDRMTGYLDGKYGIECLGSLGFENAYTLAMRKKNADQMSIHSIADLAAQAPEMTLGSDQEFLSRPEWFAVRDAYQLHFEQKIIYSSTFMYEAIDRGLVDVIPAFSTDGRIAAYQLKVLDDPLQAFPPYQAVLLLSPRASKNKELVRALKPLIGQINEKTMRHANQKVDLEKQTPAQAASWLAEQIDEP